MYYFYIGLHTHLARHYVMVYGMSNGVSTESAGLVSRFLFHNRDFDLYCHEVCICIYSGWVHVDERTSFSAHIHKARRLATRLRMKHIIKVYGRKMKTTYDTLIYAIQILPGSRLFQNCCK